MRLPLLPLADDSLLSLLGAEADATAGGLLDRAEAEEVTPGNGGGAESRREAGAPPRSRLALAELAVAPSEEQARALGVEAPAAIARARALLGLTIHAPEPAAAAREQRGGAAAAAVSAPSLSSLSRAVSLPAHIGRLLVDARAYARDELGAASGDALCALSDRRLAQCARMLRVSAATNGRRRVGPADCLALPPALWGQPAHLELLRQFVRERCVAQPPLEQLSLVARALLGEAEEALQAQAEAEAAAAGGAAGGGAGGPPASLLGVRSDLARLLRAVRRESEQLRESAAQLGLSMPAQGGLLVAPAAPHLWVSAAELAAAAATVGPRLREWNGRLLLIEEALLALAAVDGLGDGPADGEASAPAEPRARALRAFRAYVHARDVRGAFSRLEEELRQTPQSAARRDAWVAQAGAELTKALRCAAAEERARRLAERGAPEPAPGAAAARPPAPAEMSRGVWQLAASGSAGSAQTWGLRYSANADAYYVDRGASAGAAPVAVGWRSGALHASGVARARVAPALSGGAEPGRVFLAREEAAGGGEDGVVEWAFSSRGQGLVITSAIAQLRGLELGGGGELRGAAALAWSVSTDGGDSWRAVQPAAHGHVQLLGSGWDDKWATELRLRAVLGAGGRAWLFPEAEGGAGAAAGLSVIMVLSAQGGM